MSASKRQREEPSSSSSPTSVEIPTVFRRWLEEGTLLTDGTMEHTSLGITVGDENLVISLGDTVWMRSSPATNKNNDEDPPPNTATTLESASSEYHEDHVDYYGSAAAAAIHKASSIARIERMWEEPASTDRTSIQEKDGRFKIRARWFLKKQDVTALQGDFVGLHNTTSREDFCNSLGAHDILLSSHADDNCVTTICGIANVLFRQPSSHGDDDTPPTTTTTTLPSNTFVCRYSLKFGNNNSAQVLVIPFEGENDDWEVVTEGQPTTKKRARSESHGQEHDPKQHPSAASEDGTGGDSRGSFTSDDDDDDDDDDESDSNIDDYRHNGGIPVAEGSTEKRDIQVGPEHQVVVPKFLPNQKVVSRNPTLVWQPGKISDEDLDDYFRQAADILTPFLHKHGLTTSEPYSPLPSDQMEEVVRESGTERLPTLSSLSTASSLSGKKNSLLRECDADSLLFVLGQKMYNIKDALASIEASPSDFVTVWTPDEKERFDSGFRRYSGSLRMIGKGIAPTKDFKDTIDYHYRFKIPDQFRRFQDKKREQAVRMIECIETRRHLNVVINTQSDRIGIQDNGGAKRKASDWTKTGTMEATGALEERRVGAKQLLVDVEEQLGKEKMAEVADAIKRLHQKSVAELKAVLVDILNGQTELLLRFQDFLPKRLRS